MFGGVFKIAVAVDRADRCDRCEAARQEVMSSIAQRRANRRNALKSTGPKTKTGKRRAWLIEAQTFMRRQQRLKEARAKRDAVEKIVRADRYMRRAANQLVKALKGL